MFLPQFFGSSAGDSVTQPGALGVSFVSVINDIICGLEDGPFQKEERSPVIAQENVTTAVAQHDVTKQPAT
jgi:hypothetical protein